MMVQSCLRRMGEYGRCAAIAMPVLMFSVLLTFAQLPTGTILGVVRDATGAVLPGSSVNLRNANTGATRTTLTDETGAYRVPALPVGRYDITVELPGFNTALQRGIELAVTQEAVVNFTLQVGATTQQVEVTAEAVQVDTTSSSLGGLVNETRISQLPLNGRNFIDLTLMQTGVTWQPETSASPPAGTGGTKFSSNGAPITSNNYMLDGAAISNLFGQNPISIAGTTLGLGGIKEYKVITNTFSAEYGMTMGSQMVIVSKGGSNQFHGELFEYLRNSALDARNYFDTPASSGGRRLPPFRRNNFGGAFGGPIQRDKTFFWGVYEGLQQRNGRTIVSNALGAGCHGSLGTVVWNGLGTQPAGSAGPCPQLGPNPAGPNTNSVVIGSASPAVVPLVNAHPLPTDSSNPLNPQYTFPFTSPTSENYLQMRVDHNFSDKNSIFGRYTIDDATQTNPRPFNLWKDDNWHTRNQSMTLSETHIFSPTLLNTARLSASRQGLFTAATPAPAISGPEFRFIPGRLPGTISVTGLTNIAGDTCSPSKEPQDVITGSDDIFYTRGRHSLKFGTLINYYQKHIFISCATSGTIAFASVANFLRGIPRSLSARTQDSEQNSFFTYKTFGFYVQDDVRATPRLTLNLGVRYEFRTDPVARHNRSSALRNILTDKEPTIGPPLQNPSFRNFSPRLGLAWDVMGNGKTSVRTGLGLVYDIAQFGLSLANTVSGAPPFVYQFTISNPGSFTVPWTGTSANTANALFSEWDAKQPSMLQYNVSVQQQLPSSTVLTVAYAGSRGYNLATKWDQNFPQAPIHGAVTNGIGCDGAAAPGHIPDGWPCLAPAVARCATVIPSCRPNPNWGTLAILANRSKSWYDSLQVGVDKRLSYGLQFQSSYTLAKSFDLSQGSTGDATDFNHLDEALPFFSMKGRTSYDARHNWRFNVLYQIPALRSENFVAKILDGWWISSIVAVQTGYPFTPTIAGNRSTYGAAIGASATAQDRPDLVTTASTLTVAGRTYNFVPYDPKTVITKNPKQWFNPLMFMDPRSGYFGTAPRTFLTGPGLSNVDFSLNKDTRLRALGEQGAVQFRAEFFNLFNHPNFGTPINTVFAGNGPAAGGAVEAPLPSAGQILSTRTRSRQVQLALKIVF